MSSSGSLCQDDHRRLLRQRAGQAGGQGVGPAAQFPVGEGPTPAVVGVAIRGRPAPVVDALDDFHAGFFPTRPGRKSAVGSSNRGRESRDLRSERTCDVPIP